MSKHVDELVFGIRATIEAITAGKEVNKLFIQNGISNSLVLELKQTIKQFNIPFQYVPVEKLNRITQKNHQGVICFISPISYQPLEQLVPIWYEEGINPLVLILDRVTDVRNFGAICRTAECAGVNAVVVPIKGGALVNADAIKTSAGAIHRMNICREKYLTDTITFLKNSGFNMVGCSEKTDNQIYEGKFEGPTAIIMGSEEDGISPEYLKKCDQITSIPMAGSIASLNVSVAAGVILYECIRQRMQQ